MTNDSPCQENLDVSVAETVIDYNAATSVQVSGSQVGVSYQLCGNDGAPIGSPVSGTGSTICLPTGQISKDTSFLVKATKYVANCQPITVQLHQRATVKVMPDRYRHVCVADAMIRPNAETEIRVENSQPGVIYQLVVGGMSIGHAQIGNGTTITLPTGQLEQNTYFTVRASRADNAAIHVELVDRPQVVVMPGVTTPPCPVKTDDSTALESMKSIQQMLTQIRTAITAFAIVLGVVGLGWFAYAQWPSGGDDSGSKPRRIHYVYHHSHRGSLPEIIECDPSLQQLQLDALDRAIDAVTRAQHWLPDK